MYGSQVLTGSDIQTIHKKSILIPCAGREVLRDHNPIYFAVISSSEGRCKGQGPFNSTLLLTGLGVTFVGTSTMVCQVQFQVQCQVQCQMVHNRL